MKKPGWGTRLLIGMGSFILFLIILFAVLINNRQEIVVDDYYPRELKYQEVISLKQNYASLGEQIQLSFVSEGLQIILPQKLKELPVSGSIWFYAPDDKAADFVLPLGVDSTGRQLIPSPLLVKSRYRLKITWKAGTTGYYFESEVTKPEE